MSSDIFFASSNKNKYAEAREILEDFGVKLTFLKCKLEEIQSDSLENIAMHKALQAFSICSQPVIVEDDGLFIDSLNGFPGPYSSFVLETIGNKGILKLLSKQRSANFRSVIAFCEKIDKVSLFDANVRGKISRKEQGRRWGFDPIFIPHGKNKTYSLLDDKNKISHRYVSLEKFANWYLHKRKSND
jgi:XTP/dITP diphosphohydrolase